MYCTLKVLWSTVIAVMSAVKSQAFFLVQVSPLTSSVMLGTLFHTGFIFLPIIQGGKCLL